MVSVVGCRPNLGFRRRLSRIPGAYGYTEDESDEAGHHNGCPLAQLSQHGLPPPTTFQPIVARHISVRQRPTIAPEHMELRVKALAIVCFNVAVEVPVEPLVQPTAATDSLTDAVARVASQTSLLMPQRLCSSLCSALASDQYNSFDVPTLAPALARRWRH